MDDNYPKDFISIQGISGEAIALENRKIGDRPRFILELNRGRSPIFPASVLTIAADR